ncbi:MAG TPA: DUF2182 domain-containing protein [Steroidobacteraceae bacterium]|nr:DUF2182 domain-containing protein [Steroidobacteraceae bacterium]
MSNIAAHRGLLGVSAVLFAASAATTVVWCGSMSTMPGMQMPGGWTMSMTWMRMPGQTWPGAAATFLGMWCVMMVAMMLPVLVPMLSRYREAVTSGDDRRSAWLTTIVGAGYFAVWASCGAAAYPVGLGLAEIAMRVPAVSRAVPVVSGLVVMIAGLLQFTAWKARQLTCCRTTHLCSKPADAATAWRHGLRLGLACVRCCAGLTAVLLVIGVMDLRAMGVITLATVAERLAPACEYVAKGSGAIAVAAGLWTIARVVGP